VRSGRYIGVLALSLLAMGCALNRAAVRWDPASQFPPDDRRHILELAEIVGFSDVESVSSIEKPPSDDRDALAASHSRWTGRMRAWSTLLLCDSRNSLPCVARQGAPLVQSGPWVTSAAHVDQNETWRVADGPWFVDIRLGRGVDFDDAARIVLAVRSGALVNRLPGEDDTLDKAPVEISEIDADEIFMISKAESPDEGFQVSVGKYFLRVLSVRFVDAAVELYRDDFYVI
jgi:hypothetical protein